MACEGLFPETIFAHEIKSRKSSCHKFISIFAIQIFWSYWLVGHQNPTMKTTTASQFCKDLGSRKIVKRHDSWIMVSGMIASPLLFTLSWHILLFSSSKAYCPPSIHLSFDKYTQSTLQDDSGSENNGLLANGAQIVPHGGKCGNAASLLGKFKESSALIFSFFFHFTFTFRIRLYRRLPLNWLEAHMKQISLLRNYKI